MDLAKEWVLDRIASCVLCNDALSNEYVHLSIGQESLVELPDFSIASSIHEVVANYKGVVMAVGNICLEKSEGLRDRFFIPVHQAVYFYNQGATLEFDFAERFFPGLQKIIHSLQEKLSFPQGTFGKSVLYSSPNAGGFPMHFDAYYNFIFHMGGEKTWLLHSNQNVTLPIEHYDLHEYPYLPEELKSYWKGEVSSNLKENSHKEK